jgi:hypothetical protein
MKKVYAFHNGVRALDCPGDRVVSRQSPDCVVVQEGANALPIGLRERGMEGLAHLVPDAVADH